MIPIDVVLQMVSVLIGHLERLLPDLPPDLNLFLPGL
jgi:hypothetical protein